MDSVIQDFRYALRQLVKNPGFTALAALTLALGIGANIALLTLADAILLRSRPGVGDPGELVWVSETDRGRPTSMSLLNFRDYRHGSESLAEMSLVADRSFSITVGDLTDVVQGQVVSGAFFSMLRTPMALGRGFLPREDSLPATEPVVVLSHHAWQARFGGDSAVVGRQVIVNGVALTVVGVAMAGFNGADHDQRARAFWIPSAQVSTLVPSWSDVYADRGIRAFRGLGRLAEGATRARADAEVATIAARIYADSAERAGFSARTYRAESGMPPGGEREIGTLAVAGLTVTGLVLLIACANVSNLLLGRGEARRREIGIRLSLGAARPRLLRQLLTESFLLSAIATAIAVLVAQWCVQLLLAIAVPLPLEVSVNWRLLAAAALVAAVTAGSFGIVPAFDATRGDLTASLKDGLAGTDRRRGGLQGGFVTAQVALSMLLLVTSGLFLRSLSKAMRVDVGFDASSQVVALSFDLGLRGYSDAQSIAFAETLLERTRSLPGVTSASTSNQVPLGLRVVRSEITLGGGTGTGPPRRRTNAPEGRPRMQLRAGDGPPPMLAVYGVIQPDYFPTVGIRLSRGRDFTAADQPGAPLVAIVSAAFARRAWPGQEPLGHQISAEGPAGPSLTVVGVAEDALVTDVNSQQPQPVVYVPLRQNPSWSAYALLVRVDGDAAPLADAVRRELRMLDPYVAVERVQTLAQYRDESLNGQRTVSSLLAGVGGLAMLLATIGVYGVVAFAVRRRTREIGVRVALGAAGRDIVLLFIRRGMRYTLAGVGIGLAISFAITRLLSSLLFGITPTDAITFAGISALMCGVALVACWLPARRAARVDPMIALRSE